MKVSLLLLTQHYLGVPSISHNIGEIPTVVKDDINGKLFEKGTFPSLFADYIVELWNEKDKYARLCKSTYARYKELLNWDIAGMSLTQIIKAATKSDD